VLVVGDLNPDLIVRGDVTPRFGQVEQLLDDAAVVLGGSAAITAHGLARLGRDVSLLAVVGRDVFGDQMRSVLADAGVDVGQIAVHPELATGLSIILARTDHDDRAILTYPGAIPTLTGADVLGAVDALRDAGLRHVHIGSFFLQPSLATVLPGVLAEVRRAGVTVSLDTNHDPAGHWQGVDDLLPSLDLLLPNRQEVVAIAGLADAEAAARMLAAHGPTVVVKDGPAGAFAVTADDRMVTAAPCRGEVVDSTGAGDTFDAAFVDAWLDGLGVEVALRRATIAGGIVVGGIGGASAQPTKEVLLTASARVSQAPGGSDER
jgi:sugar/nucleoside kinase (ribokinase family)